MKGLFPKFFRRKRLHVVRQDYEVCNWVLVGSRSGVYGGPFETSKEQVILTNGFRSVLVAGFFPGDKPDMGSIPSILTSVRHLFGMNNFFDVGSVGFAHLSWKVSTAQISHVSFARGISPLLYSTFCIMRGKKLILQTHGMLTSRKSFFIDIFDAVFTKRILAKSSAILTLSQRESQDLKLKFPNAALNLIELGNPPQIYGVEGCDPKVANQVLFAARLHPRKNVLDFAKAAKHALVHSLRGSYVALGPDEGDMEAMIREAAGLENFRYLGATSAYGVVNCLAESAVFVLASSNEPWGNVLVASLCLGRPVVVTRSSHLADAIGKAQAGVVVSDGAPDEIARAVDFILNETNYQRLSRNAIKLAREQFSAEAYAKKLNAVYGSLIQ